ncbi:hypothetical protein KPL70_023567 [Citrus sinensis]|nr:hypothetical protein KPL70_023567 [Citrus sinensis]
MWQLKEIFGSRANVIVTLLAGTMGTREALDHNDSYIGLCIFFLPGVKVNTFPVKRVLMRKANEDMNQANEDMNQRSIVLDNFLVEVRGFSPSPLLILIFGRANILDRLDSGLPQDTIIAGDSRIDFCFVWNGWSYDMVAFVFAKDERRAKGNCQLYSSVIINDFFNAIQ